MTGKISNSQEAFNAFKNLKSNIYFSKYGKTLVPLFIPKKIIFGRSNIDSGYCFPTCQSPCGKWQQLSAFKAFTGGVEPWLKRDPVLKLKQIAFSQINNFENTPVSLKLCLDSSFKINEGETVLSLLKRMNHLKLLNGNFYQHAAKNTRFRLFSNRKALHKYSWALVPLEDSREFRICTGIEHLIEQFGSANVGADGTILNKKFLYCWDLTNKTEIFKLVDADSFFAKICKVWSDGFFEDETSPSNERSYAIESEFEFGKIYRQIEDPKVELVYLGNRKIGSGLMHTVQCADPEGKRPSVKELKDFMKNYGSFVYDDFTKDKPYHIFMRLEQVKKAICHERHSNLVFGNHLDYKISNNISRMFLNDTSSSRKSLSVEHIEILAKKLSQRPEFNELDIKAALDFKSWESLKREDYEGLVISRMNGFISSLDVGIIWVDILKEHADCILFSKLESGKIGIWKMTNPRDFAGEGCKLERMKFDKDGKLARTGEVAVNVESNSDFWTYAHTKEFLDQLEHKLKNIVVPKLRFKNGESPIMPFRLVLNPQMVELIWKNARDIVAT